MPAKDSSAATLHGPICLQLLIVENSLEALQKLPALATDDVGHLEGRPRHGRACLLVTDNLHRPRNYSPATTVATAAPAASFSPRMRKLGKTTADLPLRLRSGFRKTASLG